MIPIRPGGGFGGQPVGPVMRGQFGVGPMAGAQRGGPRMQKPIGSMKKGGKVKKTGLYKLHKGETVKKAKSKTDHRPAKSKDTRAYVYGRKA